MGFFLFLPFCHFIFGKNLGLEVCTGRRYSLLLDTIVHVCNSSYSGGRERIAFQGQLRQSYPESARGLASKLEGVSSNSSARRERERRERERDEDRDRKIERETEREERERDRERQRERDAVSCLAMAHAWKHTLSGNRAVEHQHLCPWVALPGTVSDYSMSTVTMITALPHSHAWFYLAD
jgi:hypothetical protein